MKEKNSAKAHKSKPKSEKGVQKSNSHEKKKQLQKAVKQTKRDTATNASAAGQKAAKKSQKKDVKKSKEKAKKQVSSESESSDSELTSESETSSSERDSPQEPVKSSAAKITKKSDSESNESESENVSDSDSESDSSSSGSNSEERKLVVESAKAVKTESSESESESEDSSEDSDDDSSQESGKDKELVQEKAKNKSRKKSAKKESSSESSDSSTGDASSDSNNEKSQSSDSADESSSNSDSSDSSSDSSESESSEQIAKKRKKENENELPVKKIKESSNADTDSKTIFVGRLSWNVDDEWLSREFSSYGKITNARVMTSDGRSKGFGFVDFESSEEAQAALQANGKEIDGRPINVDITTSRQTPNQVANDRATKFGDQKSQKSDTVFVGNCAFSMTQDDLYNSFSDCGEITGVRLITDKESGKFKGYGYVSFSNVQGAEKMVARNGELVAGRPVRLDFALPRDNNNNNNNNNRGGRSNRGRGNFARKPSAGNQSFSGQKITF